MDKNTFMRELEQALSVLQKDELKDILSEYEQHIDMKVKSGLSEEEAIADFGSLTELTADILGAYHVRADYAAPKKKPFAEPEKTKTACIQAGEKAARGLRGLGAWILSVLAFWKRQVGAPFVWAAGRWKKHRERKDRTDKQEITVQRIRPGSDRKPGTDQGLVRKGKRVWRSLFGGIRAGFRIIVQVILWGIRMVWNAGWICFSLFFAACGVGCLYILGLFVVLLMQHYPLAGVTVVFLGAMLCAFSAAGLGLTFLWKKEKAKDKSHGDGSGSDKEDGLVQKTEGEQYA